MNWRRTVHHIITLHNTLSQSNSFEHTEYPLNCNFASDVEKLNIHYFKERAQRTRKNQDTT